MGLLTSPKDTLDYSVWDAATLKLRTVIKKEILKDIKIILPLEDVKEIFIIGSITGYKWTENSDIDVNIRTPEENITEEAHSIRKSINGYPAPTTQHVINYFLQKYEGPADWSYSQFGVYDVLNDVWANSPPEQSTIRDPKQEFYLEIISARQQLNKFRRLVSKWKSYRDIKKPSKGDVYLENRYFNLAKNFAQTIDKNRKIEYQHGWGTPRKNWPNVVYKYIEHSDVGPEFELLKEIKK